MADSTDAARLQQNFEGIISSLTAFERTAQSIHEQEVQSLRQRIARNEETIQSLQRQNEAAAAQIVQLKDDYDAAARRRRLELEATIGRACDNRPDSALSSSGKKGARPPTNGTESRDTTPLRRESSGHFQPRPQTETTASLIPRSIPHSSAPQQPLFVPGSDNIAPNASSPRPAPLSSERGGVKVRGRV
jgi:TolA-binding protein